MSILTLSQQKALTIAPKPSSVLSFLSSLIILLDVVLHAEKRSRAYHRIMAAMSANCMILSSAIFWGTWAIPSDIPQHGTAGTEATCTAQGFLLQFGFTVPFYYASLSLCSYLRARSDFRENSRLLTIEKCIHVAAYIFPLSSASALAGRGLMNPSGPWCFIENYPLGCDKIPGVECIRGGSYVNTLKWLVAGLPLLFFFAVATVLMGLTCWTIWRRERSAEKAVGKTKFLIHAQRGMSRTAAKQAMMYLGIQYLMIFSFITRLIQMTTGSLHFPTLLTMVIIMPLQGFFNLLVYVFVRSKKTAATAPGVRPSWYCCFKDLGHGTAAENSCGETGVDQAPDGTATCGRRASDNSRRGSDGSRRASFSIFDGSQPSEQWADYYNDVEGGADTENELHVGASFDTDVGGSDGAKNERAPSVSSGDKEEAGTDANGEAES